MTETTNGWPGKPGVPRDPEKDGWHWLIRKNEQWPEVWRWNPGADGWCAEYAAAEGIGSWAESEGDGQPEGIAKWYSYRGPCLTPNEATALQARVAELEKENEIMADLIDVIGNAFNNAGQTIFTEIAKARAALEGKKE